MAIETEPWRSSDREAVFAPIRTANAFEQAIERIGRAIKIGLLQPGEQLPAERELAIRLALSRSTVREALRVLTEAGYLEARRGRSGGTFVVDILPKLEARDAHDVVRELGSRLDDTLRFRRVLEVGSAELAAERATGADVEHLAELVGETAAHGPDDYASYRAVDARLHLAIAAIGGSVPLVRALTDVQGTLSDVLGGIPRAGETLSNSTIQHHRLVAAIASHDRDAARAVMREHVEGIERLLAGLLPA